MDALAKSLAPGFLVRCLFAGAFFLVALRLPGPLAGFPVVDKDGAWIPLSLIALKLPATRLTPYIELRSIRSSSRGSVQER